MSATAEHGKPFINVTPLIDVLLVLLIIFMVAVPLKPTRFAAKLPAEPDDSPPLAPPDWMLLVTIQPDRTLKLNSLTDMGTIDDTWKLSMALRNLFEERKKNRAFRYEMLLRSDLPDDARIEKTVFIKAQRTLPYGEVVKVIDGIKGAGANPIGLQLDYLN